ncbi:MAG: hypothetical protein AAGC76_05400 [Luteibacter sp.]|uniref:hypothetical protein n=1 Tax=Luteibacter sp. TaxID=1886636 RepID=UPI002808528F|nr:hypothetical protein [Luteibacter sp.]MDQ7995273.1 hypothetical protein [Luteibacter sp.]
MTIDSARFKYLINGAEASIADASPTPAQILSEAGFEPADDFTLIQRTPHGTDVTSSDDTFDLSAGVKEFFAFPQGQAYELRINTHSIFWGEPSIPIPTLRDLGRVAESDDLIWVRETENVTLKRQGAFEVGHSGIEHLRTHHHVPPAETFEYFVETTKYTTDQPQLTGAQITAQISGWNPENSLVLEGEGEGADEVVHPTTVVVFAGRAHPAHFAVVPPATFGGA